MKLIGCWYFMLIKRDLRDIMCKTCNKPVGTLRTMEFVKTFIRYGLCQKCQDDIHDKVKGFV